MAEFIILPTDAHQVACVQNGVTTFIAKPLESLVEAEQLRDYLASLDIEDPDVLAPTVPQNPRVSATGLLEWDASVDLGSGLGGYSIHRGGNYYATAPASATALQIAQTDYGFYTVHSFDLADPPNYSEASVPVGYSDTIAPPAPLNASVTEAGVFSWDAVSVGDLAFYALYKGDTYHSSHTVTSVQLPAGEFGVWRVSAVDTAANESSRTTVTWSAPTLLPDIAGPSKPTNLHFEGDNLVWDHAVDPVVAGRITSGVKASAVYRDNVIIGSVTHPVNSFPAITPGTYKVLSWDNANPTNYGAMSDPLVRISTPAPVVVWPELTATYGTDTNGRTRISALPRLAGAGMNSYMGSGRRHLAPTTQILYWSSPSDSITDGSGNSGSLRWCLNQYGDAVIVPTFSGRVVLTSDLNVPADRGFKTVAGQFAPWPGLYLTGKRLYCRGSNVTFCHLAIYIKLPYGPTSAALEQADCVAVGNNSTALTNNVIFYKCSFGHGADELANTWYLNGGHFEQCIGFEPCHATGHPNGGSHGYGFLFSHHCGHISMRGCLLIHCEERTPLIAAPLVHMENCVIADAGLMATTIYNGGSGPNVVSKSNVLSNVYIAGATYKDREPIHAVFPLHADTRCYSAGNRAFGYQSHIGPTEASMRRTSGTGASASVWASSIIAEAVPPGMGNPMSVMGNGATELVELVAKTVGPWPGRRGSGREQLMVDHMRNMYYNTAGPKGTTVNSTDEIYGPGLMVNPVVNTVNPASPGNVYAAPFPPANPHDIIQSGPLAGRNNLEAALHNQDMHVSTPI